MAGSYCKYCDHRCFVYRIIPDGPQRGFGWHLATCPQGMENDREQIGHDHTTAINPMKDQP